MWSWKRIASCVGVGALGVAAMLLGQPAIGVPLLAASAGLATGTALPPVTKKKGS